MSTFTAQIFTFGADGSKNLELSRNDQFVLNVAIMEDNSFEVKIEDFERNYSGAEVLEILNMVVPFAVDTAGIMSSLRRSEDEWNRALPNNE